MNTTPPKGTDPAKEAPVTIDATVPTAQIVALPSRNSPNIAVSWTGSNAGGSGVASYTVYVSADGGQTYTAWLTNTKLTSGVYQGLAGHAYSFYVVATNNVGTVQTGAQAGAVSTYVDIPPQITSASTAEVMMGQFFSYQIAGSNLPTAYGAGGLPAGLSVDPAAGLISGIPTQAGVFTIGLSAANAGGTGTATLVLTVIPPPVNYPVITSAGSAAGLLNQAFSYQITSTNAPTGFGASGLPAGLSVNPATGLISGTPLQTGVFNVGLSATNADGTGTLALTLAINPAPMAPPSIISALAASALAAQPFAYQITANNMPSVYGADGLPAGLSVNTASGLISGTPATAGTYPVTLSATNTGGTGTATLTLTVANTPVVAFPVITSAKSATARLAQAFSYQISATNSPTRYRASGLPGGLSVNPATGLISGTPTATGVFHVALSATNAGGRGTATLTLSVNPKPVVVPVITSVRSANAQATVAFSYQITANNTPVSFNATGLPEGLSVNKASGLISGTPAAPGVYPITLAAKNSAGTGQATLALTVASAPLPVVGVEATVPSVKVGSGTAAQLTLTLSAPSTKPIRVHYAIKGNAENGVDYQLLTGVKKIKAGKTAATIKIIPLGDLNGAPKKKLRFILESGPGYTPGAAKSARVKIISG